MTPIFGMDAERKVEREVMDIWPNKITEANAGGPRQSPVRMALSARAAQFRRWPQTAGSIFTTQSSRSSLADGSGFI
jgi:hypothetical protein